MLIKSLISEDALGAQGCQIQLKSSADTLKRESNIHLLVFSKLNFAESWHLESSISTFKSLKKSYLNKLGQTLLSPY